MPGVVVILPQQHLGIGKPACLKRIKEAKKKYSKYIQSLMSEYSATAEQIGKAGTRLFFILYGGKQ